MDDQKRILLHTCCSVCATSPVERLLTQGYRVSMFFSNSNIFPSQEYEVRLQSARKLAGLLDIQLIEDVYDHGLWLHYIEGLENEPERGKRCIKCFEYNLRRTYIKAQELHKEVYLVGVAGGHMVPDVDLRRAIQSEPEEVTPLVGAAGAEEFIPRVDLDGSG